MKLVTGTIAVTATRPAPYHQPSTWTERCMMPAFNARLTAEAAMKLGNAARWLRSLAGTTCASRGPAT